MKKEFVLLRTSAIKPYENNPRINDSAVDAVIESINQCEYIDPIEIDENNVILSGHTRLKALQKLKIKSADCIRVTGLTEEQKRKYRLLTNKTGELADWDLEKLGAELDDLDFGDFDFGFDLPEENDEPQEISEDNYEEPAPKQPKSKLGDIYELGNHRLICGDCTDKNIIDKLMNGEKADMVFTDPPYNVAIGSKNAVLNEMNHTKRGHRVETEIAGDKGLTDAEIGEQLWRPAFQNMADHAKDDCSIYVTMPQGGTHMMMMMMADACWQVKHELMWLKNQPTFSMGRLDYDYKHEPIMYGWKKTHNFYGKGKFTKSVWEIDKPRESKLHPTMKPIELIANALENSTKENDCVLDVFGGSGSTLIACEQLNRRCFMCELDPKYVDVIIDRWEKFTGKKAVKSK
jgi:site-specific DNA-methyltransferase (adenine-specific)